MVEVYPIAQVPKIKPCPVCGKKPKIKYYEINAGWVYCKPIFGRKHKEVVVNYAQPSKLKLALVTKWNAEVSGDA